MAKRKRKGHPSYSVAPTAAELEAWVTEEMSTACIQCDEVHPVVLLQFNHGIREYWCAGCHQRRATYVPT